MTGLRLALGGLALATSSLAGCLLVDSFGNYDIDGGADASGDASRDAAHDATSDSSTTEAGSDGPTDASCGPDTSSDPRNCGKCGHDCFGGACNGSRCEPVAVVEGLSAPHGLVVTSAGIYVTEDVEGGSIYLWNPDAASGTDALAVVATGQDLPTSIAASRDDVYWTSNEGILTCPIGKAHCKPKPFAGSGTGPTNQIAAGLNEVCWTAEDSGTVACSSIDGGAETLLTGLPSPLGIDLVPPNVYFTNRAVHSDGGTDQGTIDTFNVDRGVKKATTLITGRTSPERIAFPPRSSMMFWTEYFGPDGGVGSVAMCNVQSNCTPTILATVKHPVGIVADNDNVYFVSNENPGYVYACPVASDAGTCSLSSPLAAKQPFPANIAQDSTSLYWTNSGNAGSLVRLAKPLPE